MTHEELRAKIQHYNWVEAADLIKALDAVVELCSPKSNDFADSIYWKKEILQVIEKELK
jgi:hypothetical protein